MTRVPQSQFCAPFVFLLTPYIYWDHLIVILSNQCPVLWGVGNLLWHQQYNTACSVIYVCYNNACGYTVGVPLHRGPVQHDIAYITAVTEVEYKSEFGSTKYTPYLALTGDLWGVFCEVFEKIDRLITAPHCIFSLWDVSPRPTFSGIDYRTSRHGKIVICYKYLEIELLIHDLTSTKV